MNSTAHSEPFPFKLCPWQFEELQECLLGRTREDEKKLGHEGHDLLTPFGYNWRGNWNLTFPREHDCALYSGYTFPILWNMALAMVLYTSGSNFFLLFGAI